MALLGRRTTTAGKPARGSAGSTKVGPSRGQKLKQIGQAFTLTRKSDPKMVPLLVLAFLAPLAVILLIGIFVHHPVYLGFLGVMLGLLAAVFVFGRRVQGTAFAQVEGQLGAGAAILSNMRGDWRVTPAVGVNREQDLVHRVLGRPGIVLVGEGAPNRVRGLIGAQKRQLSRFIGTTPLYEVVVGDGEGMVPLRELEKHFVKLPRNIKPAQVNELDRKLKAMGNASMPIPKGPMPTRMPRGKVR